MYKLLNAILVLLVATVLGCPEDKKPIDVPEDVELADIVRDASDEPNGDETGEGCVEHDDCPFSDLCIEGQCIDRDQVLDDCDDDLDCPEGFICVEEECEEE